MRVLIAVLLAVVLLAALVAARPGDIIDVDYDDRFEHEQDGVPGTAVHGKYEAYDAHGNEYEVRYIADELGFRLV